MHVRRIATHSCRAITGSLAILALWLAGCHGTTGALKQPDPNTGEGAVIQAGQVQEVAKPAATFKGSSDLAAAEDLYLKQQWKPAGKLFGRVADDTGNPPLFAEKARFFEAECQRLQGRYPDAMGTFNKLLIDFQYGVYREQAIGRIFEIANYWLDDTRAQFDQEHEKAEGKRWYVPSNFIHFDKTKPTLDEEGHALKMLEQVYYNDPVGPHAEKALFALGYIYFRRTDFQKADQYLSQLIENSDRNNKKSEYRERAFELAIIAKNNCSGGPKYDGRKAAEALKLIDKAKQTNAKLATEKADFLENQKKMVHYMQAQKDYDIAEFYRRTGHPATAWFYYELVRRRYNGTEFHDQAIARMKEINLDLTEQQNQTEIAKASRRNLNKWVLGHEVPTLAKGAPVPTVPGLPAEGIANPVQPATAPQPLTGAQPVQPVGGIVPPK